MVTIGMNYSVIPGKESVFLGACKKVLTVMSEIDGHEESFIYQQVEPAETSFLIVSRWQNEAAFNEFVQSDQFKKVTDWGKENILAGRPKHTTYHEG